MSDRYQNLANILKIIFFPLFYGNFWHLMNDEFELSPHFSTEVAAFSLWKRGDLFMRADVPKAQDYCWLRWLLAKYQEKTEYL